MQKLIKEIRELLTGKRAPISRGERIRIKNQRRREAIRQWAQAIAEGREPITKEEASKYPQKTIKEGEAIRQKGIKELQKRIKELQKFIKADTPNTEKN